MLIAGISDGIFWGATSSMISYCFGNWHFLISLKQLRNNRDLAHVAVGDEV